MGYTDPTPIQLRAIPLIMEGRDVIGSAQTGTGKTAAFALPILSKLGSHEPRPRVLVLEPTRELAAQVETAIRDFCRFTDLTVAVFYGGVGYGKQMDALKHGVDILVATPGRLLDHMSRGMAKLDAIQHLVLDEADRMLDMGFLPDVRRIIDRCPKKRQTSLFSATIPPQIESLIKWTMTNPETIEIGARRSVAETVKHVIYPVAEAQKTGLLLELLDRVNYDVPQHPEDYIHRIGRTGRAEATGDAFTIMVAEDATHVFDIERFISQKIPREKLEGFNYTYTALFEAGKKSEAGVRPQKIQAVRVRGGYFFGPSKRRRR